MSSTKKVMGRLPEQIELCADEREQYQKEWQEWLLSFCQTGHWTNKDLRILLSRKDCLWFESAGFSFRIDRSFHHMILLRFLEEANDFSIVAALDVQL